MWNQTKILKEKRSLSTIQTGEIKITNHWRERIKVQHKPVEVSFLACITVLSVFFLFASLLCPHLQQEAAADGSLSARWYNSAIWRTVWLWAFGLHLQHYNSTRLQPTTILSTTTTLLVSWVHEVQPAVRHATSLFVWLKWSIGYLDRNVDCVLLWERKKEYLCSTTSSLCLVDVLK